MCLIYSNSNIRIPSRAEFEVISETSCKSELSSIQLVNVYHRTELDSIEFSCFEFYMAYMESQINVSLSYVDPRSPFSSGVGIRGYFCIASSVALVPVGSRSGSGGSLCRENQLPQSMVVA